MATWSRDKTIKVWDACGTCIQTLVGHDNWVRALVFHPGGKYLLSVSDGKTLLCWDLSQEGKCVEVLRDVYNSFVTCLRWAPAIIKDVAAVYGGAVKGQNIKNDRTTKRKGTGAGIAGVQTRCIIGTGGVDHKIRIFAN